MADKDLKSLTIDGVTYRNLFTDPKIGMVQDAGADNVPLVANTDARGNSITFTEPGFYNINVVVTFDYATTTGATQRTIQLERNMGGSISLSSKNEWLDSSSAWINHGASYHIYATPAPVTFTPIVRQSRDGNAFRIYIAAFKMAKYPGLKTE